MRQSDFVDLEPANENAREELPQLFGDAGDEKAGGIDGDVMIHEIVEDPERLRVLQLMRAL